MIAATRIQIGSHEYVADLSRPIDLSFPIDFEGPQPRLFGAERATAVPFQVGDFVGAVRQGGSVNVDTVRLAPHLHGTHTECVGHLTADRVALTACLQPGLLPASLVTLPYERRGSDRVVTADGVAGALETIAGDFLEAVVFRVRPADTDYPYCDFAVRMPPYFDPDALSVLIGAGVRHLLVDLPSIDRLEDDGALAAHRVFWEGPDATCTRTITELIVVPDVPDGPYLLDLQTVPLNLDAVPSRPVLFPLTLS